MVEPKTETFYVLHFKTDEDKILNRMDYHDNNPNGYYSQKQRGYYWCFTNDISKARRYKTLEGTKDMLRRSAGGKYGGCIITVKKVEIIFNIKEN